ncbi:ALA-interacting subunit 1-like isoform X2 [Cornus florida]|uniref:ALA-interacting subunit 1-like isoform X2 n=1 Tax=Cornus florida TaxID=4283 RepID=UPI002897E063|nr:ALA-interacting subunit 1-like isoform X2 [Cornus florida]
MFTQQELPAWKPILTPGSVITAFVSIGTAFIFFGLISLFASESVVEIVDRYDKDCIPSDDALPYIQSTQTNKTCIRKLIVPKKMRPPIYIYYQLDNFYQNHRRYIKSRSAKQLLSRAYENVTGDCEPEHKSNNQPIVPCGLVAWSLFNDTYVFSMNNNVIHVTRRFIAWRSDKSKFGDDVYPKNFQSGKLIGGGKLEEDKPLSEQNELMVWMRTAALPTFRKLYGMIDESAFEPNDEITVVIQNNYNTYSFGGKKKLVLSTTSWIGGKNNFLGIAYLVVGGLCLSITISFIVLYVMNPRPMGDPTFLSWNRNPVRRLN